MRLLVGVTGLLLLIACANVANLLLFRGLAAQGELAVRKALGAGVYRLAQQNLAASSLLALLGGCAGVLCSAWLVDVFEGVRLLRSYELRGVELDERVLAFACGISLISGLLAGLVPVASPTGPDAETLATWNSPAFQEILARSRADTAAGREQPLDEVRRALGLSTPGRRRA